MLWTGHDRYLKNPDYFWNRPQLTLDAARLLASRRPASWPPIFPASAGPATIGSSVKRILHAAGAMTVEQLCNLGAVAGRSWHLFAAPLRVRGTAGSIIRACALVDWRASELVDMTHDIFPGMPALGAVPAYWTRAQPSGDRPVLSRRPVLPDPCDDAQRACRDALRRTVPFATSMVRPSMTSLCPEWCIRPSSST